MTVRSTVGAVNYIKPNHDGEELYQYIYESQNAERPTNIHHETREVAFSDMRAVARDLSLAKNGMELHKISVPGDINWDDEEEVKSKYYPLVQDLLQRATGATRVHVFDHTLRRGAIKAAGGFLDKTENEARQPVGNVHVDYTVDGGLKRLHMLFPDEADELQKTPFAIVQCWRPLKGPVKQSPLGMIDVSSVSKEDYLYYKVHFPSRSGSNYGLKYSPQHKWLYVPDMNADEAYVFVCYDSRADRVRFTPHTGFRDLSAKPDAPPRESVEIRSLCFWQNENPQEVASEL